MEVGWGSFPTKHNIRWALRWTRMFFSSSAVPTKSGVSREGGWTCNKGIFLEGCRWRKEVGEVNLMSLLLPSPVSIEFHPPTHRR